ncbi:Protein containing transglutaminase-like domain, putative cysteine protease [Actinokineospora spheciospongiae]|uniref:Protein containing transglutaminase-like domain, putative cysteine protease n=1 Tax=Actinokineospora spheciospongiae TaxID=909613 RepID=W7IUR5_9PSEU|nr:transglutaminase family protein [Actinokineospora spheciospongiae]EWC60141.1 Protein containing transglutaminase-like domain, putative cysteine protease [Actinokineospora spheciospongiae]
MTAASTTPSTTDTTGPNGTGTWRLRVVHTTGYRYQAPVVQSFNEARLTPRSDRWQNLVVTRIETTPPTRSFRYTDYWGTEVTAFDLHAPHTELKIVASSVVETGETVLPLDGATWADLRADRLVDRYGEYLEWTRYVPRHKELGQLARELRKGRKPHETVLAIAELVHDRLTYKRGTTGVHSSAVDAWEAREGVCQDYAHLTLAMLRAVGIPSRYVSGYLHTKPDGVVGETVVGESHAWVEAWTGGWWGFDPTNDIEISPRHIWVATGRDYADVSPVKGTYSGGPAAAIEVSVEVTRLA